MPHRDFKTLSAAVLLFALLHGMPQSATAQIPAKHDSTAVSKPDSLAILYPDSVRTDTLRADSDLDAPIDYEAHFIDNLVEERITYLLGMAVVKYKNMTLEAGKITVDWNKRLLIAEPLPDSLLPANSQATDGANSNSPLGDSLKQVGTKAERGLPVFSDGADRMTGEKMEFNFATEKGRVLRGRTEFQDGKYFGAQIKRVDENILNVSNGIYTTCDREEDPHFHFRSRKMKIIVQENVIAKPIVLFIGKIPLAALPFGFFPTRSGRRSGLIVPRYGESQLEGRFLRELGYYWAISDYFDARATVDFYERSGWFARGSFNYAKRYSFTGNISGSLTRKNFVLNESKERRWDIAFNHNQTLGPTASLRASGAFASSNDFYRFFSGNRQEQLRRELRSQATFSKSFGGRSSLSLNLSDVKDLETGSFRRTLPQLNINFGQRQLFGGQEPSTKGASAKIEDRPWYHNFYYSLSSSAQNSYFKASDSAQVERRSAANHNLNLSLNNPKRFFGWLSLNQSLQVNEDWFDRATDYKPDTTLSKAVASEEKGFAARHIFSYNASANTKIYGTFFPNLGPVKALRHVVTPSIGFSYRPDFSDPRWGYFRQVTLRGDSTVRLDRFNGSTPRGKLASMNISVSNLFQMKTGPEDKPKKIDLFTLNFSTSHNFAAKEFQQSDLSSSLFANPSQNISLNMSMSHSFYDYDSTGRRINQLLYKRHGIFSGRYLRLTNVNVGASFRLQGRSGEAAGAGQQPLAESQEEADELLPVPVQDRFTPEQYFSDTSVPWQASFSLSLNINRSNPLRPTKTAQLSLSNADIRLTKNWRVGVSGQFDLLEKTIIDQRYTIYRDLHCWEMQFFWTPSGFRSGFYFRLSIKAPLLQDIKLERRGGRTSVFGGGPYY
jgi:lipopolysaccharide assembly outer membrane protein LptD (OstA)